VLLDDVFYGRNHSQAWLMIAESPCVNALAMVLS